MAYPRVTCACGRGFGSNVFRQHARKCAPMLRRWRALHQPMYLLDERSAKQKAIDPIPDPTW